MLHRSKLSLPMALALSAILCGFPPAHAQSDDARSDPAQAAGEPPANSIIVTGKRKKSCPPSSKASDEPSELIVNGMDIIEVEMHGPTVRLEVDPRKDELVLLNMDTVKRLRLRGSRDMDYNLGAFIRLMVTTIAKVNFGCHGSKVRRIGWSRRR